MKSFVLILITAIFFSLLFVFLPDLPSVASNQKYSEPTRPTSRELLIGWKTCVSNAERDRIIEELGGKLKHRFTLINADSVLFDSVSASQSALAATASHSIVESVELVEHNNGGGSGTLPDTHSRTMPENDFYASAGSTLEVNKLGNSDAYTKRFPNASWRHVDYVHEAQEFAKQKQEVIIAVISDQPQDNDHAPFYDGSLLRPVLWENTAEKNGVAGVDDDNNGYVDDIHGINTIHIPNESLSLANGIINLIAGVANYDPDRLTNPAGKVKLMLITAFHELDSESECSNYWPSVRTTDTALIEALEYAANMGAKVAFVSGHYTYRKSPLVIAAAEAFPGLIITPLDRFWEQECFGDTSMLLQSGLGNVIGVGSFFPYLDEMEWPYYGGKFDLLASQSFESQLFGGNEGAVVAGVTAHLMSCYPQLNRDQIKSLLFSSIDLIPDRHATPSARQDSTRTGGKIDVAKAVLGRSGGGCFYIGDWALVDRHGPYTREIFGLVYDDKRSLLYLYGGYSYDSAKQQFNILDDFWCWDGIRWRKIAQEKEAGKYPGPVDPVHRPIPFLFDENRGELILVAPDAVWRWDGSQWHMQPAQLPLDGNFRMLYSANDFAFDSKRNRIVMYYKFEDLGPRMIEFDGAEWILSDELAPSPKIGLPAVLPGFRAPLIYNNRLGMVTVLTPTRDNLHTRKLWEYNGNRWQQSSPIESIPGTDGKYIYDVRHDRYLRFGSDNFGDVVGHSTKSPYWNASDIWELENGRWRNLGYDAPSFIFWDNSFSVVWAGDRQKALFVSGENNLASRLFTWQYSGAITPTWIDNMILPQSDYDGDGKADPALWHPDGGKFQVQNVLTFTLGKIGDIPVPGDYDGDGKVEFAVCRRKTEYNPLTGRHLKPGGMQWIIEDKSIHLGQFDDIPVPLDYDGDGKTDIAVFRKDTAEWIFQDKKENTTFGNPADLPVPADYNGDGQIELATYTPLTSTWHIQGIGDFQYGKPGDSPVPADYDGDNRADIANWNPRTRQWLVRDWSSGGNMIKQLIGSKWDIPVPGDYDGDGKVELATFNPITACWNIQGRAPFTFGTAGDVPLVRGN